MGAAEQQPPSLLSRAHEQCEDEVTSVFSVDQLGCCVSNSGQKHVTCPHSAAVMNIPAVTVRPSWMFSVKQLCFCLHFNWDTLKQPPSPPCVHTDASLCALQIKSLQLSDCDHCDWTQSDLQQLLLTTIKLCKPLMFTVFLSSDLHLTCLWADVSRVPTLLKVFVNDAGGFILLTAPECQSLNCQHVN